MGTSVSRQANSTTDLAGVTAAVAAPKNCAAQKYPAAVATPRLATAAGATAGTTGGAAATATATAAAAGASASASAATAAAGEGTAGAATASARPKACPAVMDAAAAHPATTGAGAANATAIANPLTKNRRQHQSQTRALTATPTTRSTTLASSRLLATRSHCAFPPTQPSSRFHIPLTSPRARTGVASLRSTMATTSTAKGLVRLPHGAKTLPRGRLHSAHCLWPTSECVHPFPRCVAGVRRSILLLEDIFT